MSATPPRVTRASVWADWSWWSRGSGRRALDGLLRGEGPRFSASVGLASASLLAATALLGTSAWLLTSAALRPSIAELQLAIVGVRALGLGRGVLRYLERLTTHDITLRLLARLRSSVFRALASTSESPTLRRGSGEIQARAVEDVAALEGVTVRILVPTAAGAAACVVVVSVLWTRGAWVGLAALAGLLLAGGLVPVVVARRAAVAGRRSADTVGHFTEALVDSVQGAADLLVFGREESRGPRGSGSGAGACRGSAPPGAALGGRQRPLGPRGGSDGGSGARCGSGLGAGPRALGRAACGGCSRDPCGIRGCHSVASGIPRLRPGRPLGPTRDGTAQEPAERLGCGPGSVAASLVERRGPARFPERGASSRGHRQRRPRRTSRPTSRRGGQRFS